MKRKSRFTAIFEQAATGFAFVDSKTGSIIKVNKKFKEILGFKTAETKTTFMAITHPDDLQKGRDNMQKMIAGEVRDFSMEKRYIRDDGSAIWSNLTVSALWDAGEEPDYHLAIVEDITARKHAEEKLKKTNERLDQKVADRTVELQAQAQELATLNDLLKKQQQELCEKNKNLQELNTTLKLFIQKKDEAQKEIGEAILTNINAAIEPSLDKLAQSCPNDSQQKYITVIRLHLKNILAPFTRNLRSQHSNLSPTEVKVADLIKHGFGSKKIAGHLHISSETVAFHRKNIRKKMGLTNSKDRLVAHLQKIEQD